MIIPNSTQWQILNKEYIENELKRIRNTMLRYAGLKVEDKLSKSQKGTNLHQKESEQAPPALISLKSLFNLSSFEKDLLLLCLGMELDSQFPDLCAAIHKNNSMNYPTFQLALSLLEEPHWNAIIPSESLRYWKLIEIGGGPELTRCPIRLDEKIIHFLLGINSLDQRLAVLMKPLLKEVKLAPSHYQQAEKMVAIWQQSDSEDVPVFFLWGNQVEAKRGIATLVSQLLNLDIQIMSANMLPTTPEDLESLIKLWTRESVLSGAILLLDCDDLENSDSSKERAISHVIEHCDSFLMVTGRNRRRPPHRPFLSYDIAKPTAQEQRNLWHNSLKNQAQNLEPWIERLVFQFNLSPLAIQSVSLATFSNNKNQKNLPKDQPELGKVLWNNCRLQARPRLEELVQRIEPKADWENLVLPEQQLQILKDIAIHVRQRGRVYETWDFISKGIRGLGISALFAGASGTGKTMAAEVLAKELDLDLYRIDLSTVVNKYIGETEKNLRKVFDMAEEAGAILLFDEADALFGKRSEVKDSHDRYANIEISYLLQRMEEYRGLAILTTNLKDAMDKAFMRRLRFIVNFPFPGPKERLRIWQKIFPEKVPTQKVEIEKLAKLNISGGNIRNIALNAAFYAAEENSSLTMAHLLKAATAEYHKLDKTLTEEEIRGWQSS